MKMQLQSLREQLWQRTGRDPIDNPEPSEVPARGVVFFHIFIYAGLSGQQDCFHGVELVLSQDCLNMFYVLFG